MAKIRDLNIGDKVIDVRTDKKGTIYNIFPDTVLVKQRRRPQVYGSYSLNYEPFPLLKIAAYKEAIYEKTKCGAKKKSKIDRILLGR